MKHCIQCSRAYPPTSQNFGRNANMADGLETRCNKCRKESRERQKASREPQVRTRFEPGLRLKAVYEGREREFEVIKFVPTWGGRVMVWEIVDGKRRGHFKQIPPRIFRGEEPARCAS